LILRAIALPWNSWRNEWPEWLINTNLWICSL
jgi:hypothetical protein